MQAIKRKEENSFSGVIKKLLLFSFFCLSFSILVFAVVSAATAKVATLESYFDLISAASLALVVTAVSFFLSKKSSKPFVDALSCGIFLSFLIYAVSLICGSGANVATVLIRLLLVPLSALGGALLSRISGSKKKKRRVGKSRVNASRKKY